MSALGCTNPTPHENYLQSLHLMVGKDIRNHSRFDRMEQRTLPNGNAEYRFTGQIGRQTQPCTDIYEVDPKTYIVLRADFAGTPADCVIAP